jgi:serine/threonine protein kinase
MNQAGPGWIVHTKNATFSEAIMKQVESPKDELSKIISSPHDNLVPLQEVIYHEGTVYFIYDIMDVSLAQVFGSPLGRLQLFEVAAFTREILAGIEHIHKSLEITHGSFSSASVLLSVSGNIKIGL